MACILSIYIDPDTCTCSQACVYECPEVFDGDTEDGVPRIREGAEQLLETHVEQIKLAAHGCPVEAVFLEIEGADERQSQQVSYPSMVTYSVHIMRLMAHSYRHHSHNRHNNSCICISLAGSD
jgi:ferredoxin